MPLKTDLALFVTHCAVPTHLFNLITGCVNNPGADTTIDCFVNIVFLPFIAKWLGVLDMVETILSSICSLQSCLCPNCYQDLNKSIHVVMVNDLRYKVINILRLLTSHCVYL